MHAVVVRVRLDDEDLARQFLTDQVVPRVSQAPGFVAGYWARSDDGSNGMSMIVFESEENARAVAQMIESSMDQNQGASLEGTEVREVVASA
jgi:hypothetical protein